ncbi:TPA: hypothetical protein PXN44_004324 [Yersinia enterocolitica]|nr:hypothetical protein [Yersinia enterocolitica]
MLSKEQYQVYQDRVEMSDSEYEMICVPTRDLRELLSLREQLEALNRQEPFGYIDAVHNWNYTNLKSELNTVAFISKTADGLVRPDYAMALFTAAKPAED